MYQHCSEQERMWTLTWTLKLCVQWGSQGVWTSAATPTQALP